MAAPSENGRQRFFIGLIPPPQIQEYAELVIQELGDRYQTRTSNALPHITLQPPFLLNPDTLAALEVQLSTFVQHRSAVPVKLSGFGAFSPRVLYINVLKTPELLTLQVELMTHLEETIGIVDSTSKRRGFSPHLTVASRNLNPQTFRQAWTELQERQVAFEFVSDRLTLLIYDGHRWHVRSDFPYGLMDR